MFLGGALEFTEDGSAWQFYLAFIVFFPTSRNEIHQQFLGTIGTAVLLFHNLPSTIQLLVSLLSCLHAEKRIHRCTCEAYGYSLTPIIQYTQWDPGIMNLVCRATLQIFDTLYKSCAPAASANNGVCHYWDYIVAVILATSLTASADIQMFKIMDILPSSELPCGIHHDWDLMLLGTTHHDWIFDGSFLGYDSDLDHRGYAANATRCWSAFVALQVQTPWDTGGSAIPWYLIIGLRTSRILRGRECHAPRVMFVLFHWALLQNGLWSVGLAQVQESGLMHIYEETSTEEGDRRIESSPSFSSPAPVSHLML
jgi:hypothetical protein